MTREEIPRLGATTTLEPNYSRMSPDLKKKKKTSRMAPIDDLATSMQMKTAFNTLDCEILEGELSAPVSRNVIETVKMPESSSREVASTTFKKYLQSTGSAMA